MNDTIEQHLQCCVHHLSINDIFAVEVVNKCVTLFMGYRTSDCLRPCRTTETKSKLVSRMKMNKPDEMRIRIKFNPTVTVTTTDFVKPSLGVFMSEVKLFCKTYFFVEFQVGGAMGLWLGLGIVQVFICVYIVVVLLFAFVGFDNHFQYCSGNL